MVTQKAKDRFKTLTEILDYIDQEVERRIREKDYKPKTLKNQDLEISIHNILKTRPVSCETISYITGYPTNKILMKLRRMEKWKQVKQTTKKEVIFWDLPKQ